MLLNVALILQNFDLKASDPSYVMDFMQTITIKPIGFRMHARLRGDLDATALERRLWGGKDPMAERRGSHNQRIEEVRNPMSAASLHLSNYSGF